MANKEKSQLKILIYQDEIAQIEKKLKSIREQKLIWQGYGKAVNESREIYNQLFLFIRQAMDWQKMSEKEREAVKKTDPEKVPKFEITEEEGAKIAAVLRPAQNLITSLSQRAAAEPGQYAAIESALVEQVQRLQAQIDFEANKDTEGEAGEIPEEPEVKRGRGRAGKRN